MCGPHRRFAPLLPRTLRRIPQAVGAVATCRDCFGLRYDLCSLVSIPQAVGAVATSSKSIPNSQQSAHVSIPQAVGAVATVDRMGKW